MPSGSGLRNAIAPDVNIRLRAPCSLTFMSGEMPDGKHDAKLR